MQILTYFLAYIKKKQYFCSRKCDFWIKKYAKNVILEQISVL